MMPCLWLTVPKQCSGSLCNGRSSEVPNISHGSKHRHELTVSGRQCQAHLDTHTDGPGSSRRVMTDGQQEGTFPREVIQLWEVRPYGQGLPPAIEDAKGPDQRCDGG